MSSSLLPENLEDELGLTKTDSTDEITDLQGKLAIANDALTSEQDKVKSLEGKIQRLEDNSQIKKTAVGFAKTSLILIPTSCLFLFLLSAMDEKKLNLCGTELDVAIKINAYAQAALIVAPIAFFATIIGFLLKGVFGQNVDVKNLSTADVFKAIDRGR